MSFLPIHSQKLAFTLPLLPNLLSDKEEVIVSGWALCIDFRIHISQALFCGSGSYVKVPYFQVYLVETERTMTNKLLVTSFFFLFGPSSLICHCQCGCVAFQKTLLSQSFAGLGPLEKTMSENVCTESCITVKGDAYEDSKERIVGIYVSAESLKVYENPWVEDTSPGPLGSQHPGMRQTHTAHGLDCCVVIPLSTFRL